MFKEKLLKYRWFFYVAALVAGITCGLLLTSCHNKDDNADVTSTAPDVHPVCGGSLGTGTVRLMPVGCIITGDVSTGNSQSGPWHYEKHGSSRTLGTIVVVEKNPTYVYFDNAGYADSDRSLDQVKEDMKKSPNCEGNGCKSVHVVRK